MLFLYLTQNEFCSEGAKRIQKYLGNGLRADNQSLLLFWGSPQGILPIKGAVLSMAGQSESLLQHTFQQQVILGEDDMGKKEAIHSTQWQSKVLQLVGLGRSWQERYQKPSLRGAPRTNCALLRVPEGAPVCHLPPTGAFLAAGEV